MTEPKKLSGQEISQALKKAYGVLSAYCKTHNIPTRAGKKTTPVGTMLENLDRFSYVIEREPEEQLPRYLVGQIALGASSLSTVLHLSLRSLQAIEYTDSKLPDMDSPFSRGHVSSAIRGLNELREFYFALIATRPIPGQLKKIFNTMSHSSISSLTAAWSESIAFRTRAIPDIVRQGVEGIMKVNLGFEDPAKEATRYRYAPKGLDAILGLEGGKNNPPENPKGR